MAKVVVAILNWNGEKLLPEFLPSVIKNTPHDLAEIVVIDNASTDKSIEILSTFPTVKIVKLDTNYGFAEGYNRGLKLLETTASYFVLLNSDVEVTPRWIEPVIEMMEADESIAMAQPKILSYKNKSYFEYAGAAGGFIDKHYFPFCRGRIFDEVEKDEHQYDTVREIFWASGAALFIRREVFFESGGFDTDFFAHMEEIDLAWRLKNRGYKVMVNPHAVVYHLGGASMDYMSPRKLCLNFRNNFYMMYKNLPSKRLWSVIPIRLFMDTAAAFKFLLKGQFAFFWAIPKAHCGFWFNLWKLRKKRRENLQKTISWQHLERYPKSIVGDYFIRKKTKFSELKF